MIPQWIIEQKRDGNELSPKTIRTWVEAYARGDIPDYQMAALAMAIYFKGMTFDETAALTEAMMRSGDVLDFSTLPRPTADKHSTGGIGDKISIPLAPLVAACGVAVPMISGRGLGLTGGTLDKLDAIPGYDTRPSASRFPTGLETVGCPLLRPP
ncbi:MAG: thymidine phosphorylase, partial [Kiritimatiellaeota bacterium]|nr:thymidine phosphorylase [Kiritimatiellota bacterium]